MDSITYSSITGTAVPVMLLSGLDPLKRSLWGMRVSRKGGPEKATGNIACPQWLRFDLLVMYDSSYHVVVESHQLTMPNPSTASRSYK